MRLLVAALSPTLHARLSCAVLAALLGTAGAVPVNGIHAAVVRASRPGRRVILLDDVIVGILHRDSAQGSGHRQAGDQKTGYHVGAQDPASLGARAHSLECNLPSHYC